MQISNLAIRLLTLASYLLPFVFYLSTCTAPLSVETAYNEKDAILNEEKKISNKLASLDTLFKIIKSENRPEVYNEIRAKSQMLQSNSDNLTNLSLDRDKPQYRLIFPGPYSISGVGTIWLHKNTLGKTLIAISLALSFLVVIHWHFLKRRKVVVYFIGTNIVAVLAFMVDCFVTHVTILFGSWTLLFLLIVQILSEYHGQTVPTENDESL